MIQAIAPPANFEKLDKLYVPKHHTVADWDFEFGATNRSLSPTQFVSPPTSLRIQAPTGYYWNDAILCRVASTLCLPQGELRTWVYEQYPSWYIALFRNQAALGTANMLNGYQVWATGTLAYLHRFIAGGSVLIGQVNTTTPGNTWTHWRVVFWNGQNPLGVAALCVDIYQQVGGVWVKQGDTLYDTTNQFKDSAINRAGFRGSSGWSRPEYWDDTEIWAPV